MEKKVLLEVKDLIVFFENAIAVNSLSINVSEGEIVALFGPNSSGKTTVLNAISGILLDVKKKKERMSQERITIKGKIVFDGEEITWIPPYIRARKGIIISRSVFSESSVEENLLISGYLLDRKRLKERMDFVYSLFPHLKEIRKRKAGLLSGGEQKMLSISMALIPCPKLLLLDEPLFGLSPGMFESLLDAIRKIKEEGTSVLIAEQFAIPVLPLIDRGYVIENGSLVIQGKREDLIKEENLYFREEEDGF